MHPENSIYPHAVICPHLLGSGKVGGTATFFFNYFRVSFRLFTVKAYFLILCVNLKRARNASPLCLAMCLKILVRLFCEAGFLSPQAPSSKI